MDVNIYTGGIKCAKYRNLNVYRQELTVIPEAARARTDCNVGLLIYGFHTLIFGNTHLLDTLIRSVSIRQITVTTDGAMKTSGKNLGCHF